MGKPKVFAFFLTKNSACEYNVFGKVISVEVRVIENLNEEYLQKDCINLVPFGLVERIDYRMQLRGNCKDLVFLGKLSKKWGGITLIGVESDNCNHVKKSVLVFEGSHLTAICDMNAYEEKFTPSFGYKTITFKGKKIGVLVDRDLFNPTAVSSFVNCGVSAIINLYEGFCANKPHVACEFYSYVYGVDVIYLAPNERFYYDAFGDRKDFSLGIVNCGYASVYKEVKKKVRGNNS